MNDALGDRWKVKFGKSTVMNHYANGMLYIQDVFGEPHSTFVTALENIQEAEKYGIKIPVYVNVVCVCKKELRGKYTDLQKIVSHIKDDEMLSLKEEPKKKRNTLWEDFREPLDKIQRNGLRRGALLLITPVVFLCGALGGMWELTGEMYSDCWDYNEG